MGDRNRVPSYFQNASPAEIKILSSSRIRDTSSTITPFSVNARFAFMPSFSPLNLRNSSRVAGTATNCRVYVRKYPSVPTVTNRRQRYFSRILRHIAPVWKYDTPGSASHGEQRPPAPLRLMSTRLTRLDCVEPTKIPDKSVMYVESSFAIQWRPALRAPLCGNACNRMPTIKPPTSATTRRNTKQLNAAEKAAGDSDRALPLLRLRRKLAMRKSYEYNRPIRMSVQCLCCL